MAGITLDKTLDSKWEVARQTLRADLETIERRLNAAPTPLSGTRSFWVSLTSGGPVTTKLTFTNGLLVSTE